MVIVRLLLILGLGTIGIAFLLFLVTRERRYLTFVVGVAKLLLVTAAGVLAFFVLERALLLL